MTKGAAEDAAKELAELLKEAQEAAKKEEDEEKAKYAEAERKARAALDANEEKKAKKGGWEYKKPAARAEAKEEEKEEKEDSKKEEMPKIEEPTYQKTVNLREEMDPVTSQGIYQDYLMFCMQGDTVNAPMGVQITIERDQSEFCLLYTSDAADE